jgi:hypothetical protein
MAHRSEHGKKIGKKISVRANIFSSGVDNTCEKSARQA